ncbi:hypothetical protein D3C87_1997030 [compost metagenome]
MQCSALGQAHQLGIFQSLWHADRGVVVEFAALVRQVIIRLSILEGADQGRGRIETRDVERAEGINLVGLSKTENMDTSGCRNDIANCRKA